MCRVVVMIACGGFAVAIPGCVGSAFPMVGRLLVDVLLGVWLTVVE